MNPGAFDIAVRGVNAFLMLAPGLALGAVVARRWKLPWSLFGIGAATFVLSQIGHLLFNSQVLNGLLVRLGWAEPDSTGALLGLAAAVGLSAGVFEETARYLMYRFWARRERRWEAALMIGAGHGGIEAVLLGLLALYALIQVLSLRGVDLAGVVPPEQLETTRLQIEGYWALPWYGALLGALERASALCLHLSLSVLVLQAFTRRNALWLGLAIAWHALANAAAVVSLSRLGPYATEALVAVFALLSVGIVYALRPAAAGPAGIGPSPSAPLPPLRRAVEERPSDDRLDDSRYSGGAV